jgi:predicted small secreted protein
MRKNLALILIGLFFVGVIAGCNMMKGMGKDIENVGEGVQKI